MQDDKKEINRLSAVCKDYSKICADYERELAAYRQCKEDLIDLLRAATNLCVKISDDYPEVALEDQYQDFYNVTNRIKAEQFSEYLNRIVICGNGGKST